ncbi:MAG: response regulator [Filimonas sp.]|nr:response regulator [Filimonas sp.]
MKLFFVYLKTVRMYNYNNLLLLDDDADDRAFFKEALSCVAPGVHCHMASNGREGLSLLSFMSPDIIVADINMPVMNGRVFLQELHTWTTHPPVIMMSTCSNELSEMRKMGAAHFFQKPITFKALCTIVQTIFEHAWTIAQLAGDRKVAPSL